MKRSWLECVVWAALTVVVLGLDMILVGRFIFRISQGTLGMWEPPLSTIMALTFLLIVGCYAVHITNPRRPRSPAEIPHPDQQIPEDRQDQQGGEDHEGGSPRVDSGKNDAE
jgi:hypothetical protein